MISKVKKVLIVIHDMKIGGAQKSLLSFLQSLAGSAETEQYQISMLVICPEGELLTQIPSEITLVQPDAALRWMGASLRLPFVIKNLSLRGIVGETIWLLQKKCKKFPKTWNVQQQLWNCWKRLIPECKQSYDIAISYIDGPSNYYVMDKVRAKKKVLWIHNEYQKLAYEPDFDRSYYETCDKIITISDVCRQCIEREFPHLNDKLYILENISLGEMLVRRSQQGECPEYAGAVGLKLLSVGRLNYQKGFDIAIQAAWELKKRGISFLWLVAGEGDERQNLQSVIDQYGLANCVCLMGIRENPYVYMRMCDIVVQSSRWEGKSIVLDEAKILQKPIVCTNYKTVGDVIQHGETGWITDMNGKALADGIMRLAQDEQLREKLKHNLEGLPRGNERELQRYIDVML